MPDPRDEQQADFKHAPYDIEVEQAMLGALMIDPAAFYRLEDMLEPEDYYDPLHSRIFEMIGDRMKRKMAVTPLTVHASMKTDPGMIELGGMKYLSALTMAVPDAPNIKAYARIIRDLAGRRQLIKIGQDLISAAYEPPKAGGDGDSAEAIGNGAAEQLYELTRRHEVGRGAVKINELMGEAIDKTQHAMENPAEVCLTSGLKLVDQELGGLYRGDLAILAGAPNMGKSAFAAMTGVANGLGQRYGETRADLELDKNSPREPIPTLFFSLEMADWQLGMREIAERTDIPSSLMRRGKVYDTDIEMMRKKLAATPDIALKIDGGRKLSTQQIRARSHAQMRYSNGKLGLIIIDHLRFIRPANWKQEERDQIQQITSDLKDLAVELNVSVLLLSHLNREYSKRQSKRPINSDLYGASAIEQNADAIWFLHSESYYLEREETHADDAKKTAELERKRDLEKGWMEVFSTKARMDKVGKARVRFEPAFTRFSDPEYVEPTTPRPPQDLISRAYNDPLADLENRAPPRGE